MTLVLAASDFRDGRISINSLTLDSATVYSSAHDCSIWRVTYNLIRGELDDTP